MRGQKERKKKRKEKRKKRRTLQSAVPLNILRVSEGTNHGHWCSISMSSNNLNLWREE